MSSPSFDKSVVKIVQLRKDSNGNPAPVVLYKRAGAKRKVSEPLRPLERTVRRVLSAQSAALNTYLEKHNQSNEKSKDGWLRDMVPNLIDSADEGKKKLRIKRLVQR